MVLKLFQVWTFHLVEPDGVGLAEEHEGVQCALSQYPPVFSAIKKDGKRLYEHARKGETVEIAARKVSIREFEITRIALPEIDFRVTCSKGTYIRSLAFDFGKALNSGGHLTALRRTKIGDYSVENALSPDDFVAKFIPEKA